MNLSETVDLSVVIVTHNGRELTLRALESAMAATGDITVEWILVDSGSTDGVADAIVERWPRLEVTRLPNLGFAAANNVGFAAARGRYVLALNPDTEIRAGTFAELVHELDGRPAIGAAGVIQESADGSLQASIRRDPSVGRALSEALWLRRLPGLAGWQESELREAAYLDDAAVDWVVGAFLVLRREALDEVVGFDERFFMYSEEADLCRRVRASGWEVRHLPTLRILHHGGAPSPRLVAQHAYSRLAYARKHQGSLQALAFRGVVVLHHLIRTVALALVSGRSERVAGQARALKVALGIAPPPYARRPAPAPDVVPERVA
jgi:GT2 family glycosyltransferase